MSCVTLCCWHASTLRAVAEETQAETAPSVAVSDALSSSLDALPPAPEDAAPQIVTSQAVVPQTRSTSPELAASSTPVALSAPGITPDIQSVPRNSSPANLAAKAQPVSGPSAIAISNAETLQDIARREGLALPLAQAHIVIVKSARRLDLFSGSTLVKTYHVALGKNPRGAKKSQGDGRTPEGRFYICTRNAQNSGFHVFLGLSYPALPDAKRAVSSKQISPRDYQIITRSLASRGRPPWGTRLGGWVGIHGGTNGSFAQKRRQQRGSEDWTAGCIGLTDREIEELYAATRLGTPVEIEP